MPIAASIYLSIYALLIIANGIYSLYGKSPLKGWMLLYEIASGAFIIFMAAAFWSPTLKTWPGLGCVVALLFVILLDMRFTISGTPQELGIEEAELSEMEVDAVKGLSLAFAAPAYLMGMLLSADIIAR